LPVVVGAEVLRGRELGTTLRTVELPALLVALLLGVLLLGAADAELLGILETGEELPTWEIALLGENPAGGAVPFAPAVRDASAMLFETVAWVTQLEELGVVNGAVGVTVSPTVYDVGSPSFPV